MIDVVLPALDEADALPGVLSQMPESYRPIVVDNGSSDDTGEVAARLNATVVVEAQRGFGAACCAGLRAATAAVVRFMDAGGPCDPSELPQVADPVAAGDADLVLAARAHQAGARPLHARLGNRCLTFMVRRRAGLALRDPGPMQAARRDALLDLGIVDRRSGWPLEMVTRAAAAGWRITEVTSSYRPRVGRSKVTGTVRVTLVAAHDMSRVLRDVRPARP